MPDFSHWPIAEGKLRSGVGEADQSEKVRTAYRRALPPQNILSMLSRLLRGRRADFLYTYSVSGRIYTGSASRTMESTLLPPRLYGRSAGETIRVRYSPDKPEISAVLAEDNQEAQAVLPDNH